MKHGFLPLVILSAALLLVTGCARKDMFSNIHIKPNTSLPVGMLSISDSSLFAMADVKNGLSVNSDGVLMFSVKHDVGFTNPDVLNTIFKFTDQTVTFATPVPGAQDIIDQGVIAPGTLIDIATLAPSGIDVSGKINIPERIDEMIFNGGYVVLDFTNDQGYDMSKVNCLLKNLLRNGEPLNIRDGDRIDFNDGATYSLTPSHDADGVNYFDMKFTGQVPLMTQLRGSVIIHSDGVKNVTGYFGSKKISTQTTEIKMPADFSKFTSQIGSIYLADPSLAIHIDNTVEAPTLLMLDNLKAVSIIDGVSSVRELVFKNDRSRIFVDGTKSVDFLINNSSFVEGEINLSDVMNKELQNLVVVSNVYINPTAQQLDGVAPAPLPEDKVVNELSDDASMNAGFVIDLPIDGVISDISVVDTIKVDLSGLDSESAKLNELSIAFSGVNNLPMDIVIMADVRDGDVTTGTATQLFSEPIKVPAANNFKQGEAGYLPGVISGDNMVIIKIKQDVIDRMLKAKMLFIDIKASTYQADQATNVKFYSPTKLDLKLVVGLKADFKI